MMGSIPHRAPRRDRPGFLLLEVLLGVAVFGVFMGAVMLTLLSGQEGTMMGGDRVRGLAYAAEAVEAVRAVRDGSFGSLTAGTHGLQLNASRKWILSGTQSTRSGGYVVKVDIASLASNWVSVAASAKWKHGIGRSGSVLVTAEFADWRGARYAGDWSSLVVDGSYVDGGTPLFNEAAVSGNYAYVTSETSSGGAGLYVFDITDTAAPSRVASSFSLGAAGYAVAVKGKTLYVVTADPSAEIRAYDVTSPTTLSSGNLLASYDLPGSGLATSLALQGKYLYVGARNDATHNELYSFNVANTGAILLLHSLAHGATVNGIALSGTAAYLATSDDAAEMDAVNVAAPSALSYPTGHAYNFTDRTQDSLSVAVTGSSALVGSEKGSIQELVVVDTRAGGGSPPDGALYHEGSGSLVGLASDPRRCYAFLAAASGRKALQVVDLRDAALGELATYTSTSGLGRGLFYDVVRDRVLLLTQRAVLIFRPAAATGSCS